MKLNRHIGLAALTAALCGPALSHGATFNELGDAGQLRASANQVGIFAPTAISGAISLPTDADLYAVTLTAGTPFTAQSGAGAAGTAIADTQLFLFDAAGNGLRYNDDLEVTNFYSQLAFTPVVSGIYHIGISAVGFNPQDAAAAFIYARDPFDPAAQPGPSPAGSLAAWAADGSGFEDFGSYTIDVTGVSPVPEPAAYAQFALGLLLFAALRRRFITQK